MLGINLTAKQKKNMVRNHSKHMLRLIKIRLSRPANKLLLDYFKNDKLIREVLETKSDSLLALNTKIWNFLTPLHAQLDIREALKRTFSETSFFNKNTKPYNAYRLCQRIGLNTCPYCNIQFIPTVITKKPITFVARPPLDHFFANTLYPLLAISFYNLVPGCDTCNSRFKLAEPTHHLTHLNPHTRDFADECIFRLEGFRKIDEILAPGASGFKIKLYNSSGDKRFDGNEILFHLNDMYSVHRLEARNCLIKSMTYSTAAIESIVETAKRTGSDAFELIFEARLQHADLHLNPLSKLKRDIVLKYASAPLKSALGI